MIGLLHLGVTVVNAQDNSLQAIRPFLAQHCDRCHGNQKDKGGINLQAASSLADLSAEHDLWETVIEVVNAGDMPPRKEAKPQADEAAAFTDWVGKALKRAANTNAGDPGLVTIRRLTNREYDNCITDLTGINYGLATQFPADSGGGEGFANTGDVLFISPETLDKYLQAARKLSRHASILPASGIRFHKSELGTRGPEAIATKHRFEIEKRYTVYGNRWLPNGYKDKKRIRMADYLAAAWRWHHRQHTGFNSLRDVAKAAKVDPVFLQHWYDYYTKEPGPASKIIAYERSQFSALPAPQDQGKDLPPKVKAGIDRMVQDRHAWWPKQRPQQDINVDRGGSISAKIPKDARYAHLILNELWDGNKGDTVSIGDFTMQAGKKKISYRGWLAKQTAKETTATAERQTACKAVLKYYGPKRRQFTLQAPLHLKLPLPAGTHQCSAKWRIVKGPDYPESSFQIALSNTPLATSGQALPGYYGYYAFTRPRPGRERWWKEYGITRTIFPDIPSRATLQLVRNLDRKHHWGIYYFSDAELLARLPAHERDPFKAMLEDWPFIAPEPQKRMQKFRAAVGLADGSKTPADLNDYHKRRLATLTKALQEQQALQATWDARVIEHLQHFAERAWRRPITTAERDHIAKTYQGFLNDSLTKEDTARLVLIRILIAPSFLYKTEQASAEQEHAIGSWELINRLSFFLWAGPPDKTLKNLAADGSITDPAVLSQQVTRMLAHKRARGLAEEFFLQWLHVHDFASHNATDRKRFPEFTDRIRSKMHEQVIRFCEHIVRNDRPIMELFTASYTFADQELAQFYGIPAGKPPVDKNTRKAKPGQWLVKTGGKHSVRGGLLGMGAILTKNSYPLRTSPVLRGNFLLEVVLGDPVPEPPTDVPPLPEDDQDSGELSLREHLLKHRENPTCAACHDRIDPLGFAMENFDPIGRWRKADGGGHAIDNRAELADGTTFSGMDGLRSYLNKRQQDIHKHLCKKLIGYALGRNVLATDIALLNKMVASLAQNQGRLSQAITILVSSRQFLHRRNQ